MTIHTAAAKGMVDQIESFLADDPKLIEAKGREGETPIVFLDLVRSG